jgi:NitT/TauT family transport system permease protein
LRCSDRWAPSQRKIFRHLQLPAALPHVFGGMEVAITLATVGAIVAEFVGADRGLGYVLLYANGVINSRLLFAALTLISALALAFYWAVGLLERLCIPWHTSMRAEPLRGTL